MCATTNAVMRFNGSKLKFPSSPSFVFRRLPSSFKIPRVCPTSTSPSPKNSSISAQNRRPTLANLQFYAKESAAVAAVAVAAVVVVVDNTVVAAQSSPVAWRTVVAGTSVVVAATDLRPRPSSSFHRP